MFGLFSEFLASLMRNYYPKRPSGALLHTLSKLYDVPVEFLPPPPYVEAVYCFICGCRRVAVALYRMICLVFSQFVILNSNVCLKGKCEVDPVSPEQLEKFNIGEEDKSSDIEHLSTFGVRK